MRTAFAACRFGWPAFVVPFLFVIAPNLIMRGSPVAIAVTFVTAIAGIWLASAGLTGYLLRHMNWTTRILYMIGGLALLIPSQAFPNAFMVEIAGGILCAVLVGIDISARRRAVAA